MALHQTYPIGRPRGETSAAVTRDFITGRGGGRGNGLLGKAEAKKTTLQSELDWPHHGYIEHYDY